jgi:hypothetical protein
LFLALPAVAAEDKATKKKDSAEPELHFFKLGVRPIDPSGEVNWEKECVVVLSAHSPKIRLQYKKADGSVGVSGWGNVKKDVEVIVDGKTGYALRLRICGNGIVEPKDWMPVGEEFCKEDPPAPEPVTAAVPEQSQAVQLPTPALTPVPQPASASEPEKPLDLNLPTPTPTPPPVKTGMEDNKKGKKSKTWLYVLGGALAGGLAFALLSGGDSKSSGGGPAKDPRN